MTVDFTEEELTAIRSEHCKGATDAQFTLFISECRARQLRPGVHLVFQLRNSKEYDPNIGASVYVKKAYWITTVAALRLIAQRTGEYLGQGPGDFVYLDDNGLPTIVSETPLPVSKTNPAPREPWVARAKVFRKDFVEPTIGFARFEAYAGTRKEGNNIVLTDLWSRRGSEQLQKCAEALALRKAFPEDTAGLILQEEIRETEDSHETPSGISSAPVSVSAPSVMPKVNQTPAEAETSPRPDEIRTEQSPTEVPTILPKAGETPKAVSPNTPKAKALAAVPNLKSASEIVPKKKGRPTKEKGSNSKISPAEGITDEDFSVLDKANPKPSVEDETAVHQEAEKFVASLDPTPTREELATFAARARALEAAGAARTDLKNYILNSGGKTDPKQLTVRDWETALSQLEAALTEGKDKLKGVTSAAPLPKF